MSLLEKPLADLIRPKKLSEFVGQEHLIGIKGPVRKAIENNNIYSIILWGPPGCGKTTLARVISNELETIFVEMSAVNSGVSDIKKVVKTAKDVLKGYGKKTILFIDEIHRFNKAQQDLLLPYVEDGTVILIGATTENPSFEVISPLLSRSRVYVLNPLSKNEINKLVLRGLKFLKYKGVNLKIKKDALNFLLEISNGDARVALNVLDALTATSNKYIVDKKAIENVLQKKSLMYDKGGEEHYNTISAFIKSIRGSSPDAALYYLARMVEAGEDPLFIARRLVILASEDIGIANNNALLLATATFEACEKVGYPECQINLAHCTTYLALSKKSNKSYMAYLNAYEDVKKYGNLPIPLKLRNAPTKLMKDLGYGKEYKYAHEYTKEKLKNEVYLPEELKDRKYL